MGVCKSKSTPIQTKKPQTESVTAQPRRQQRASTTNAQKITTVQFQEPTSIHKITTPVKRVSPNQTQTPVHKTSPNNIQNTELPLRKSSSGPQGQTMIVSSQKQEGSLLNIPNVRPSTKLSSKSLQSPASRNYSVVQNKLKDKTGTTIMQHNETGQIVLVELLNYENRNQQYLDMLEEIKFDNMHIVKVLDIHEEKKKRQHQIIYEHCPKGKLSKFLEGEKLSEEQVGRIMFQMVEAISYIHTLGYSHDELTIDSFSIFDEINATPFIKLTDIRSIFQFMYPKNSTLYEPPNSHSHQNENNHHQKIQLKDRNQSNDVWALGVITLQLLHQKLPFEIEEIHQFNPEHYFKNLKGDIYNLLIKMLTKSANERITLQKCLSHSFLIKMKQVQPKDFLQPLHNIIKCKKITYLHKLLFQYLLQTYATDHIKVLTKLFATADVNKDASLSKEELYELFSAGGTELIDQLDLSNGMTQEEFILLASDKDQILTENCIEQSFKTFSKQYNYITPKQICKILVDADEEQLQVEFNKYNLNYQFYFEEYQKFLLQYESPMAFS